MQEMSKDEQAKQIASGKVSETVLQSWTYDGVKVSAYPPVQDGSLRIEISDKGVFSCQFHGDRVRCVRVLELVVKAMKHPS